MLLLGAPSSSIFSPQKVSSLSLWLDAADTRSITATSNQVTQWRDKSANNFHVSQANTSFSPLTNITTRNNLNVLGFDGTNDYLINSSNSLFRNVNGFCMFVVFQTLSTGDSRIVHKALGINANNRAGFSSRRGGGTKYEAIARRLDADAASITPTTSDTNSSWNILGQIANFTAGTNAVRLNKIQQNSTATTVGVSENTDGGSLVIGANGAILQFLQGNVAEVIAYSKILSTTEIGLVENYLSQKWSI